MLLVWTSSNGFICSFVVVVVVNMLLDLLFTRQKQAGTNILIFHLRCGMSVCREQQAKEREENCKPIHAWFGQHDWRREDQKIESDSTEQSIMPPDTDGDSGCHGYHRLPSVRLR